MQTDAIFSDGIHSIYVGTDSTGRAQVEFRAGMKPGWNLTIEDAERVSLQILTDSHESLTLDHIVPGPGSGEPVGALLVRKDPKRDRWILAHSSWLPFGAGLDYGLDKYLFYEHELQAWNLKSSLMRRLARKPELSPDLGSMQVWRLERLDAQRMALAILEGIGRQSWIPALSAVGSKRKAQKVTGKGGIEDLLGAFVLVPLLCIGVAVLMLRVMNWAIENWLEGSPIPYSSTDVLLVAILVGVSYTMWVMWLRLDRPQ